MAETRGSRNPKNWSQDQDETKGFIRKKREKRKGQNIAMQYIRDIEIDIKLIQSCY